MSTFNPKDYENKWQGKWAESLLYKTAVSYQSSNIKSDNDADNGSRKTENGPRKYYSLYSFPYPSGSGLHVGHVEGMVANDIAARYYRMKGYDVLIPMGWDAFGLPAENYAIKTGVPPAVSTEEAINNFIEQINNVGISVDWSKELGTHRPNYYKWTQWIFLQLYKAGLAYKKKAPVNWCPKDQTVLANEQVIDGRCERCDTEVVQKDLEQWFFKITDFADRLDKDLDKVDWPEGTKQQQRNWIGKSVGAEIVWGLKNKETNEYFKIRTFTTRFDTIPGPTFLVVAPEYEFLEKLVTSENKSVVDDYVKKAKDLTDLERQTEKTKTGVFTGSYAINPYNNEEVPIYVADYVLGGYGTGAVMGMPGHDQRDYDFAKIFNLPVKYTLKPKDEGFEFPTNKAFEGEGYEINSGEFDGLFWTEAREKIINKLEKEGKAIRKVNYRIRDWLVSRQRYWGCPIPIVYDPEGNAHPIDEKDLPLLLPEDVDFMPTGESPIARSESFKKSAEEKYGAGWHYEVDTMDTFVDSSWYYFRYTDVDNTELPFAIPNKNLPIIPDSQEPVKKKLFDLIYIFQKMDIKYALFGSTAVAVLNKGFHKEVNDLDFFVYGDSYQKIKDNAQNLNIQIVEEKDNPHIPGRKILTTKIDNIEVEFLDTGWNQSTINSIYKTRFEGLEINIAPISSLISLYASRNNNELVSFLNQFNTPTNYWLPTDLYMIGAEHTVLHLLYSRFFTKFFYDKGWINFDEPFYKMRHMGLILGPDGRKMSKRWGNVINPNDEIEKYGADTLRMYEMFMGPLDEAKPWNDRTENGVFRFLSKVWTMQDKISAEETSDRLSQQKTINKLIKKISDDIENLSFNTSVAKFMETINEFGTQEKVDKSVWETFLKLLAPFAPFITEELWSKLGHSESIHTSQWPEFDESLIKEEKAKIVVQVNGKVRANLEVDFDSEEAKVLELAKQNANIQKYLTSDVKKVIFVKNRILNLVV